MSRETGDARIWAIVALSEVEMLSRALSFDTVAHSYHNRRPRYPVGLYNDLLKIVPLRPGARILDVGAGSGIATLPLAARGFEVVALEPGPALAALARRNLSRHPNAVVHRVSFERARLANSSFSMIVSATAWHWVDPLRGPAIAARVLPPGGSLALWWMGFATIADSFAIQCGKITRSWVSSAAASAHGSQWASLATPCGPGRSLSSCRAGDIDAHPDFHKVDQRRYLTTHDFDADSYVQLLGTYADFVLLPAHLQSGLYADIRRLINEHFAGKVTRTFVTTLYVWRRRRRADETRQIAGLDARRSKLYSDTEGGS